LSVEVRIKAQRLTLNAQPSEQRDMEERNSRKLRQGKVVSDKMDKTVVVEVANLVRHPLYGRTLRRTNKYKAHDETNDCHVGDTVEIMETRPLSRDKRWRVNRVVERAK
jgi:small subunit ribosomal protein S17